MLLFLSSDRINGPQDHSKYTGSFVPENKPLLSLHIILWVTPKHLTAKALNAIQLKGGLEGKGLHLIRKKSVMCCVSPHRTEKR